jgi:hypothetical protein
MSWLPRPARVRARVALLAPLAAVVTLGLAGGGAAEANGASVTTVECGILLPGILPEGQVVPAAGQLTVTRDGNATLVCHGQSPVKPAKTTVFTDIPCALGHAGQVGSSQTVVTTSGHATLVCHLNPSNPPPPPGGGD